MLFLCYESRKGVAKLQMFAHLQSTWIFKQWTILYQRSRWGLWLQILNWKWHGKNPNGISIYPLLYKYLTITKWKNSGSDPKEQLEQWSESSIKKKLCKALVANHVAKVSVMFDKTKYVRTQRNLKVTFADQLGALGIFQLRFDF